MSNKTTNLGLSLVDTSAESTVNFAQWRRGINSVGTAESKSDFQIIDEFAGHIYGVNGVAILSAEAWDSSTQSYTLSVEELGENDAIFLTPASLTDKTTLEDAGVFVSTGKKSITITATKVPVIDINLKYFIARGA